jgi:hypothetical protein
VTEGEYKTPLVEKKSKFDLSLSSTDITAKCIKSELVINERSKQYSQGRGVGVAFVNQGGDFLAGRGIEELEEITGEGIVPFGAVQFGKSKYKTGTHANPNINGHEVLARMGKNFDKGKDKVLCGIFFEE